MAYGKVPAGRTRRNPSACYPIGRQYGKGKAMGRELNDVMEWDHVVRVMSDGTVRDDRDTTAGISAPEIHLEVEWDAYGDPHMSDVDERQMVEYVRSQGWNVWQGDVSHGLRLGPIIHPSCFIGGALEDLIRNSPGFWVACAVVIEPPDDENGERSQDVGWLLAHRDTVHYGQDEHPACEDVNEFDEYSTAVKDVNCADCKRIIRASV